MNRKVTYRVIHDETDVYPYKRWRVVVGYGADFAVQHFTKKPSRKQMNRMLKWLKLQVKNNWGIVGDN